MIKHDASVRNTRRFHLKLSLLMREKPKHAEQNYEEEQRSATPAELHDVTLMKTFIDELISFTNLSKTPLPYDF